MVVRKRLPGVYFQTEPPQADEVLPRMDIAAFVGFAESGPLHTPVPVEDMARFREIFGNDLELAWDEKNHQKQYSYLAPAVEAFFHNGGRRCWIVRVADKRASYNLFQLPGIMRADDNSFQPATARARSEGTWSDALKVGTVINKQVIDVVRFEFEDGKYRLDVPAQTKINEGDLLQLSFGDNGAVLFFAIKLVQPVPAAEQVGPKQPLKSIKADGGYWFLRLPEHSPPHEADAVLLTPNGELSLPRCHVRLPDEKIPFYRIEFELSPENVPEIGSLIRVDFGGSLRLLLRVTAIDASTFTPQKKTLAVCCKEGLWPINEEDGQRIARDWLNKSKNPSANRLTFDLWVWHGKEQHRISELGFSAQHPRFWGKLPVDSYLFNLKKIVNPLDESFMKEASDSRFPIAGPEEPAALYLPLDMPLVPNMTAAQSPIVGEFRAREENGKLNIYAEPDTAMQRNGLENFSADLFLDPDLAGITTESLLGEANHKYYLRDEMKDVALRGFYSLLPLDEVTIVAIPDAVLPGWTYNGQMPLKLLTAPKLRLPKLTEEGTYTISWSRVKEAESYTLQEGTDPAFMQSTSIVTGKTKMSITGKKDCSRTYYYRVRATRGDEVSPWSNTRSVAIPLSEFVEYKPISYRAPNKLEIISQSDGYCYIQWSSVPGDTGYILEEARDSEFLIATVIYSGNNTKFRFICRSDDIYYYRVRAEINGEFTPWSRTQILVPASVARWTMNEPESYDNQELLALQRALLRFCAARGDLLAVLALPSHFCKEDILNYLAALRTFKENNTRKVSGQTVPALDLLEERVLSFGSLYHPWLYTSEGRSDTTLRFIPPDGAICGILAAGAIAQGAWIAPANVSIKGVVSLNPLIGGHGELFENQVNLILQEPRGFLIMNASTLSLEPALQPINVRRLLILLRRLAFREGTIYVFQPNNEDFHHLMQHKFERLLEGLYTRGAFAGEVPSKAFQVVADKSINTPQSLEMGYFIVELKVAPSLPMAFITVRLIQAGNEGYMIEEV